MDRGAVVVGEDLAALREFVGTSHVLFGSDFPYVTAAVLQAEKHGIESGRYDVG
jgi:hypothetical protein